MATESETEILLATGSLGTEVNLEPLDELTLRSSWDDVPNRVWVGNPLSLSPTLYVGLPRDSRRRQAVLGTVSSLLSTTETGIGNVEDFLSVLSLLGVSVDPFLGSSLFITDVGTRYAKRWKVHGIVGREKIVVVHCSDCGNKFEFEAWDLDRAQEKATKCTECGTEINDENVFVL